MNRESLTRSLKASEDYYARLFPTETPAQAIAKKRQMLMAFYRDVLDMELHIRAVEQLLRHKYSPAQPRVPAGNPDGGQWTSEGGNSGDAADDNNDQPDINEAIEALQTNALSQSTSECAKFVRIALDAGGFDITPSSDAKDYGPALENAGFISVASGTQPSIYPASGYRPQTGDVTVIQSTSRSKPGHMAMYDGGQWISDFRQNSFWPGTTYLQERPNYVIYRYPH